MIHRGNQCDAEVRENAVIQYKLLFVNKYCVRLKNNQGRKNV
jgi:hypothetical protein